MFNLAIKLAKRAFEKALQDLPEFKSLSHFQVGNIVDKSFKSLMKDLMDQFGMLPNKDYNRAEYQDVF